MKRIKAMIPLIMISLIILTGNGCRSTKSTTTVRDSLVVREYDVPVKIKEQTINNELDLNELCRELENIKSELRRVKGEKQIIYRTDKSGSVRQQALIDSLGNMLLIASRLQKDTTVKGKETIKTRTEESTEEKKGGGFFQKFGIWVFVILIIIIALQVVSFVRGRR